MNAKYCSQCGAPLHPNTRFCSQCGSAVQAAPAPPPPPAFAAPAPPAFAAPAPPAFAAPVAPAPVVIAEPILETIPALQRRKGFLGMGRETLSLILTPVRLVFLPVTTQQMNDAVRAARQQAKDQGKGFFGQWSAQLAWIGVLCEQYRATPLDALIAQHPGSFFILNGQVSSIRLKDRLDRETNRTQQQMTIQSVGGKYRFELIGMPTGEARQILKQVLPHAVR
jgi:zinc ribbon protein